MKYVVMVPVTKESVVVVSRHKTLDAAKKKASSELHVYELLSGDMPSVNDVLGRSSLAARFRHAI